ncbi:MAG: ABC transporter permease [Spirochaetota bacterium]
MTDFVTQPDGTLKLRGSLTKREVPKLHDSILSLSGVRRIDLSEVTEADSSGVALLDLIRRASGSGSALPVIGAKPEIERLLALFEGGGEAEKAPGERYNLFARVTELLIAAYREAGTYFQLSADIIVWSIHGVFDRRGQRRGALVRQLIDIGVNAVGIVALLSLILGLILALQSAAQLEQFGANVFVAMLLSLAVVREMGPMMTAILVAGRSGSAIAAEIATMKVSEELDALRVMGLDPVRYVVVPKFHAITIAMPILVALSIAMSMLGGVIIGAVYLEVSPASFFWNMIDAVDIEDLTIAIIKSTVFAWHIVIIGSHYGFKATGGAEGVGRMTTVSVVASIFVVILTDVFFSFFYLPS